MAILNFSGQGIEIDVTDFWFDDSIDSINPLYSSWSAPRGSNLRYFDEAQNVTLSQDIQISNPLDWDDLDNLGTIEAGTVVDSHFIYLKQEPGMERESFTGIFTFDGPILGFMADDELFGNAETRQTLNGNDELVGYRARVLQDGNTLEGPNSGLPEDTVKISGPNDNILEVEFTSRSAVDPLRVITLASGTVPNPPAANQTPTATNDGASTDENTAISIDVLANDTDPDGDSLNVSLVDDTNTQGAVSINNDGTISYDPNAQFQSLEAGETATDSFTYMINDGQGGTDTATVSVTINGVSSPTEPPDNGNNDNTEFNEIIDVNPNDVVPGIDEKDTLVGTDEPDLFILGDAITPYYTDGDIDRSGWGDNAKISGLDLSEDQIQLHGSADDYVLVQRSRQANIFYTNGQNSRELVGILLDYSTTEVSLADDVFTFVEPTEPEPTEPEPTEPEPTEPEPTEPEPTEPEPTEPEPTEPEPTTIRIEAETATTLTNYTIQEPLGDFASGDAYIRLNASTGEAIFTPDQNTLSPGVYDVVIGYFEENDGEAQLSVQKGNEVLDEWTLNQASTGSQPNATTFVERTVATDLSIAAGDQFSIRGVFDAGEVAAVDYLEFVPAVVEPESTPDPTPDPTPEPSQSYANANQGIFVNLEQGVGFVPDEAIDDAVKIMALGDSITFGVDGEQGFPGVTPTAEQGGYRTELSNLLEDLGVEVDFVGSLSNGPDELSDTDHEGHPGWRTSYLRFGVNRDGYTEETSGVEVWLPEYEPDAILLMSGANDANNTRDVSTNMFNQIERLVKQINDLTDEDPTYNNGEGAELVLASITPVDADRQTEIRAQNVEDYNQLIRDNIVGNATYDLDAFVDIGNAVTVDDLAPVETGDNGLHPTQTTYNLMAELWYEGLLDALGSQDDLSQVNNLIGSNFDDVLTGNAANNRIEGGNGSDELTGNAGADTFVYQQPTEGVDIIRDFDSSQGDQLEISASGFGGSLTVGTVASDQFVLGTEAADSNDRFLYDSDSGNVLFDIDGNGSEAAMLFLTLDGSPTLSANDFNIV
ncbi:MAG: Ig-like domain-containing protein [Cyanobacteria bacterium J06592_8]